MIKPQLGAFKQLTHILVSIVKLIFFVFTHYTTIGVPNIFENEHKYNNSLYINNLTSSLKDGFKFYMRIFYSIEEFIPNGFILFNFLM